MDINNTFKIKYNIIYILILTIITQMIFFIIYYKLNCSEICPIDYEIKNIDDCYLTIHNLISTNLFDKNNKYKNQTINTYIYKYSKPYLIQMINNSSNNILCKEFN